MDKKVFIPSGRFGYIFGTILLIVFVISLFRFPFGMFKSLGPIDEMKFSIGFPFVFFEVDMLNIEIMPIKWVALVLSFLGYLLLSYFIDIFFSFILSAFKKPEKPEEVMTQARKAYFYYKGQGLEESKIRDLFKQKGWKDEDIDKLK
jgi:hypothetical protein